MCCRSAPPHCPRCPLLARHACRFIRRNAAVFSSACFSSQQLHRLSVLDLSAVSSIEGSLSTCSTAGTQLWSKASAGGLSQPFLYSLLCVCTVHSAKLCGCVRLEQHFCDRAPDSIHLATATSESVYIWHTLRSSLLCEIPLQVRPSWRRRTCRAATPIAACTDSLGFAVKAAAECDSCLAFWTADRLLWPWWAVPSLHYTSSSPSPCHRAG